MKELCKMNKKKKFKTPSNQEPSSNQVNCLAPSTLGQEEEVEQLAMELDLTFSSEKIACDMDDLL